MFRERPMYTFDLALLVAFTAVGLCWFLASRYSETGTWAVVQTDGVVRRGSAPEAALVDASRCLTRLLLTWSAAFIVVRLRRPRPALRDLPFHLGSSSVLVVLVTTTCLCFEQGAAFSTLCLVPGLDEFFPLGVDELLPNLADAIDRICVDVSGIIGANIVAAWLIMRVSNHLRFGGGWLETFGALIGFGWIVLLFEPALTVLCYFY